MDFEACQAIAAVLVQVAGEAAERLGGEPEVGSVFLLINALSQALVTLAGDGADQDRLQQGIDLATSQLGELTPLAFQMRQRPTLHA
ncbi:hypothetical protein J2X45_003366 [Caulobacter sp. BE264]|uniref:hypothetical protein n=1 Tax=Caulobacter sp. BE264 TaxID=2817724 RepID=UPI00285B72F0|nr:hypothetical protein [Caulobacter sp. BE264]MDR7232260.1 hypothetical protein [Caulobacter sp. BE264]